jgi:hypothetical protein
MYGSETERLARLMHKTKSFHFSPISKMLEIGLVSKPLMVKTHFVENVHGHQNLDLRCESQSLLYWNGFEYVTR